MSKNLEILNKPNELISLKPKKDISITQRKAYNVLLKHAQNLIKFYDYKENVFTIDCDTLHKKANLGNKNLEYIYNDIKNLMTTVVEIIDKENPKNWEAFTLLSHIKRVGNYYYYELNQFIINALKEQDFFTPLNLVMINSLTSQYSIIFYEMAIRYNKVKIPKMSIEEIREITNTKEEYKLYNNFKKRVLDTACKEISEKTDINLSYTVEKKGKKVAFIDFKIERKQIELPLTKEDYDKFNTTPLENGVNPELDLLYSKVKASELTSSVKEVINKYYKEKSLEYIISNIEYTNKNAGKNYLKYLKQALESDYCRNDREKKEKREKKVVAEKVEPVSEKKQEEIDKKEKMINEIIKYLPESEHEAFIEETKKTNPFKYKLIKEVKFDKTSPLYNAMLRLYIEEKINQHG